MSVVPTDALKELAPTGKIRAAINLGNPVLAQGTMQAPSGVTVDLARELAKRAGVPLELVPFDAAGKVFEVLKAGASAESIEASSQPFPRASLSAPPGSLSPPRMS